MTSLIQRFVAVFALLLSTVVVAEDISQIAPPHKHPNYVVAIELHTTAELHEVLARADQLLREGVALQSDPAAVTFILHGPEVRSLLRKNYLENKETVDLAARLSALGVVEVMACKTWMGGNSVAAEDLQPFVGTVDYGPDEIRRLVDDEDYLYF
ncbi:MAG: acyl-CoA transferase [Proteobacteria bacterium]|nr:acyl-CoA transferase [Pseudomonadota bacterium]